MKVRKGPSQKAKLVRDDLLKQLQSAGKYGKHYEDMVDDYIRYLDLKDCLNKDLIEEGVRILTPTGNGHSALKPNESLPNMLKVTQLMLKILNDLGLQAPKIEDHSDGKEDDYLKK